ncbi:MAG: hypothetical protein DMG57_40375 [Acidobacteria bacterium]|nr:MAG: hypothetical protein DMG57_40375 [Acidobacteriota bacterium]
MFLQFDKLGVADIFRVDLSGWSKKTGQGDIQFPKMAACFRILTSPVELLKRDSRISKAYAENAVGPEFPNRARCKIKNPVTTG